MDINQAMAALYANEAEKARLKDRFYVFCVLSDLCHTSFDDMRLVKLFGTVDGRVGILETLMESGLDGGLAILKAKYDSVSGVCEYSDYKKLVFAAVNAIDPHYIVSVKKQGPEQPPAEPCVRRKKHRKNSQAQFEKKRTALAKAFYNYYWKKYWSVSAIHFIRRKRIFRRGCDWYAKISEAKTHKELDQAYVKAKSIIDVT